MKRLIYILLFIPFLCNAQAGRFPFYSAGSSGSYSDNFDSYTSEDHLGDQANWVDCYGILEIYDHDGSLGVCMDSSWYSGAYYNGTVDNNQFSQITFVEKTAWTCVTVGIRMSLTGNFYTWFCEDGESYLVRVVSGAQTILASNGDDWTEDDVIRLEIDGDDISCYRNGSLDTSISADGIYTDDSASKLSSGYVGVVGRGSDGRGSTGDNWSGGDL